MHDKLEYYQGFNSSIGTFGGVLNNINGKNSKNIWWNAQFTEQLTGRDFRFACKSATVEIESHQSETSVTREKIPSSEPMAEKQTEKGNDQYPGYDVRIFNSWSPNFDGVTHELFT
jgi:hypothetical protein